MTVAISLATVPSPSILALLESPDVSLPPEARKRLKGSGHIGVESLRTSVEAFQVEQVGVNCGNLSLELLDNADAPSIARAAIELLRDTQLRERIGKTARLRATQNYSYQAETVKLRKAYDQALSLKRAE